MAACTFFGHREILSQVEPRLRAALVELIEQKKVYKFFVGNQGDFDRMVRKVLKELKMIYTQIDYAVVLAYFPKNGDEYEEYSDTIYPLEGGFPKFAIERRNYWMIEQSTYAITYVRVGWGGASKFKSIAEKRGLTIVELCQE